MLLAASGVALQCRPSHASRWGHREAANWLAAHAEGTACVIGDPSFAERPRVRSLSPQLAKGMEFDLVVLVGPRRPRSTIEAGVDRYVAMTRATRQLVMAHG